MRLLIFAASLIVAEVASDSIANQPEINYQSKLLKSLLIDYDPRVRPVKSHWSTVLVDVGLTILNIKETSDNEFIIRGWLELEWTDEYLQWNPSHYGNISEITLSPIIPGQHPAIWTPDINLVKGHMQLEPNPVQATIYNNGKVSWTPLVVITVQCSPAADRTNVTCDLIFISWVFNNLRLDIRPHEGRVIDVNNFTPNKWNIADYTHKSATYVYSCCQGGFPRIDVGLTLSKVTE